MRVRYGHVLVGFIICIAFIAGCEDVKKSVLRFERVKDLAERVLLDKDRDVYRPIREGRVAPDTLPNGPELMTWEKYYRQRHDWHVATYTTNYEKYGHRSAAWDDQVKEMLADYAVFRREHTDRAFKDTLLEKVNHVIALGCKDPRVICIKGILMYNHKNALEAAPYLKEGLALIEKSDYPRRYVFFAASHLASIYGDLKGDDNPWRTYNRAKMKYMGQAAADEDYGNGHQRYYVEDFLNSAFDYNGCALKEDAEICFAEIAALENIDPWIAHVTSGVYHVAKGWRHRGSGYAASVTQEGWDKFEEQLDLARTALSAAHDLHPEYPEAATHMIRVAMAKPGDVDLKEWFNRAVNAHFDYIPAYDNLMWALRPRWRGSRQEMLKFGIACLNTRRYDTRVPSQFLVSLYQIGDESSNWRAPYQWPGIYDLIQQYFDGILNEPRNREYDAENKSFYAVVAWAAGHYADADRLIKDLGDSFDDQAYSYLKVTKEQVHNEIKGNS